MMLRELNSETLEGRIKSLRFVHVVLLMFKPAWEYAFKTRNLQG